MEDALDSEEQARGRAGTRERLIEAAGQMFAARGLQGVTAREICELAGVNPAAVNYHFDGLEGLYEAVLIEVRTRAAARGDQLQALLDAPAPFEDKLLAILAAVVKGLLSPDASSWVLRLASREIMSPSPAGRRELASLAAPRVARVRAVVGAFVGLSPDDPRVALACLSVAAPLQLLLIGDRQLVRTIHPSLDLKPGDEQMLVEHFHRSAMAGLQALKAEVAAG
jgi:AcrR family transcriptional regulator